MMTFNLFTDFLIVFAWTRTQSLKIVILAIDRFILGQYFHGTWLGN